MTIVTARYLSFITVLMLVWSTQVHAQPTYVNPVIPGDHPDPTLTRIGTDYYTTGSSFNVTPKIYHSTDLVHWRVLAQPVRSDWELFGNSPAGGVWGGHTVYHHGLYWHYFGRGTGGREMYYVTSHRPEGPWGTPIQVQRAPGYGDLGVDNSIFIDEETDRWFLLTKAGHENNFLVELGIDGQPNGNVLDLRWLNPNADGNPYGWAEGPVMWKHEGYYYYSFAEHLVGVQYVMRSEVLSDDPDDWSTPRILFESVRDANQRTFRAPNHNGPAVTAADGTSWMISHGYDLSGSNEEWKALGRQGLLSQIVYEDGWPLAVFPSNGPVAGPDLPSSGIPWTVPRSDMFNQSRLAPDWSFLGRTPRDAYSLSDRAGWLRLTPHNGRTSVVQNAAEYAFTLITRVDFQPTSAADEAGLWTFNGPETLQAKLHVAGTAGNRTVIFSFDTTSYEEALDADGPVWLRMARDRHNLTASYSLDGETWSAVGEAINASRMDRDQAQSESGYDFNAFTGNQQGLFVLGDTPADFDLYIYRDAYSAIPANVPANFTGVTRTPSRNYLGGIQADGWAMYPGVEFGQSSASGNYARVPQSVSILASSAGGGGTIEVRVDSLDGAKIAEIEISPTDGWSHYETFSGDVESVSGQRDVFLQFAGTGGGELFRVRSFSFSTEPAAVSVDGLGEALRNTLRANHPNPFSGSTTIAYEIRQSGHVKLDVYDLVGRNVSTIVDEVKSPGSYAVEFNGADLPSGLYFYRLSGSDFQETRTMVLVK